MALPFSKRELGTLLSTQRKLNGLYVFTSVGMIIILWILLGSQIESINQIFGNLGLNFRIDMHKINNVAFVALTVLILPTMLFWSIRNKLWEGKRALKRYCLILNLRKEMIDANYRDERHVTERVLKIPTIKVEFDNKDMTSGKLIVRDSLEFHDRLAKATFTPSLKGFKVEDFYLSDDGDWWIYNFYSVDSQIQAVFDSLEDYLNWSNETTNRYQLRIDKRLSFDLKHTLLVGATRSGKTYGLIGLLLQMINKSIHYELFFADPKNDQLRKIGNWINAKNTAYTTENIVDLIDRVYQRLIAREQEMAEATLNRMTGDYCDVELEPIFLIFDEFSSFINVLDNKEKKIVLGKLTAIVQRGAGAGVFLFLIMQKSDATTLPTAIRSNLLLKIVLGNASSTTYTTTFESSSDVPNFNFLQGQGVYLDDTMTVPKLLSFPYLRFIDSYNNGEKDPVTLWKWR